VWVIPRCGFSFFFAKFFVSCARFGLSLGGVVGFAFVLVSFSSHRWQAGYGMHGWKGDKWAGWTGEEMYSMGIGQYVPRRRFSTNGWKQNLRKHCGSLASHICFCY
jgi:hypothetical protein